MVTGVGTLLDEALGGDTSAVHVLKRLGDLARRGDAMCDLQMGPVGLTAAKLAHQTMAAPDERVGLEVLKLLDALTAIVEGGLRAAINGKRRSRPASGTPSTRARLPRRNCVK